MKDALQKALTNALVSLGIPDADVAVEHAEFSNGDYATGVAMKYAKQLGMTPRSLAEKIVAELGEVPGIAAITVAGPGFINFALTDPVVC